MEKLEPLYTFVGNVKCCNLYRKQEQMEFPRGTVNENLPADAEDTGSIAGPGRFPFLWGN
ncbi:hypothetical protein KIN20_027172 [Parelaphostrongylus tenuis]|uniref:Uncharacterized protein n=1 Tax=Parelaphostrongylus tenuis TaxID=148309 RepID=A0AAD5QYZ3_PARTN|nr:hypothetical protein KIN20_027172 [Parelaphostrongylus tenuis]